MTARTPLAALALLALLASGCEAAADPEAPPSPAASTPATTEPTTEPATEPPATSPSPAPSAEPSGAALLTAVRLAHQEGFDRITFEFSGALPRFDVRYTERPLLASGSGEEIEVGGDGVLLVRLEPASGYDIDAATPSYEGSDRLTSDTTNVVELVRVGDFEAVLEWAAGVRVTSSYEVTTLDDPPRVVVDVTAD